MVTLGNAAEVLKSFYLDAIVENLNTKINPFMAKIERTSNYVTGKEVCKTMRLGINGGIGAGTETGDLPASKNTKYVQLKTELKNLYGTIEISDKAIRASANNEGAFVNLVNEEMETLIKSATFNFGRMLFGSGDGKLGVVIDCSDNKLTVDNVQNFAVGMYVDLIGVPIGYSNMQVVKVDYLKGEVEFNSVPFNDDHIGLSLVLHNSDGNELTGLNAIFGEEDIYGNDRTEEFMQPYMQEDFGEFTEGKLEETIDDIEKSSGDRVNFIICSWDVRRQIRNYYQKQGIPVKTMEIEGGFPAIEILGIPVVVDKFCPAGTMYLLNTDYFKLCQLCDWQWLEGEDGKILKQVPGKPVYTATLVKYAELLCEKPTAQGKLTGVGDV